MAALHRRAQSAGFQFATNNGRAHHAATSRTSESPLDLSPASETDPLYPLRTMADRVGKEVEKFAERVDHWHAHGNENPKAKYHTTLRMVAKFKDLADNHVRDLKRQNDTEHRGELARSVRRRIQHMADSPHPTVEGDYGRSVVPSVEPSSSSVQELRQWQAESATWDLLRIIIEHYYPEPGTDVHAVKKAQLAKIGDTNRYSPNSDIWDRFLLEDDQAKEKALILKWLEQTADSNESDIQSITEQLETESGKGTSTWTSGWLDTKTKIKQSKRLRGTDQPLGSDHTIKSSNGTYSLVTHLDPDAPTRQQLALEKSDDYYERALWMACYEMLRRGTPWEEVCEWCKERNEAWRGVSIGAANEPHSGTAPNVSGASVGYLFRRMCMYQARGARYKYEVALYGLLSGDFKSVEPVCRTWDDYLYARYSALLLSRFDGYLIQAYPQKVSPTLARKFVFQDAVASLSNWESSSSEVIDILKQQKNTASQALSPLKLIQGSLIGGTFADLIRELGDAAWSMMLEDERPVKLVVNPNKDPENGHSGLEQAMQSSKIAETESTQNQSYQALLSDPHALRMVVHVLIVLRQGLKQIKTPEYRDWAAVDNVIALYIEFLRQSQRIDLIPLYAAQLDPQRQSHCLGRILPDIKNPDEQKRCVNLMISYKLDAVDAIAANYQCVLEASGLTKGLLALERFKMLEKTKPEEMLWPGYRVKAEFLDEEISPKDEAMIECLQWYTHVEFARNPTFLSLTDATKHFLLNGRIGAAKLLTSSMSVENLSRSMTEQYCGYSFDFTQPGTEEQDPTVLSRSLRGNPGRGSGRLPKMPDAEEHAQQVNKLRKLSQSYLEMQQLVEGVRLLNEWREEEDELIKLKNDGGKVNAKAVRELFDDIEEAVMPLFTNFLNQTQDGLPLSDIARLPVGPRKSALSKEKHEYNLIKLAYIPELVLAWISAIQACSYFLNREIATKAMDMATLVADEENAWLRLAFQERERLPELVEALAMVSRGMLALGEHEGKSKGTKKRGWKGESLKIWDVNVRN